MIEQFRNREIADEGLGELEQPAGVLLAAPGLVARRVEVGDDLSHQQCHDEVDDERQPVRPVVDRQGAVGGQKEDVVQDEPDDRGQRSWRKATGHDADDDGNDERQGGRRDTEVGPEGHQQGQESPLRSQGEDDAENSPPVRCAPEVHRSQCVSHSVLEIGSPGNECSDGPAGRCETSDR